LSKRTKTEAMKKLQKGNMSLADRKAAVLAGVKERREARKE